MSWTIGKITLPVNPNKISVKSPTIQQKNPVLTEAPWLFHMGPDTRQLHLKGIIWNEDDSLDTLDTNYIIPLDRYTQRPWGIGIPVMDVNPSGNWTAAGATIKNTGNSYVKNKVSLHVVFNADTNRIYYEMAEQMDFGNLNIVSLWIKGGLTNPFCVTFYNETYAARTNGYRFYPNGGASAWNQNIVAISTADGSPAITNTVGTPTGWDKIRTIVIESSGIWNPGATAYHFDAFIVGWGWKVSAPRAVYDGIWTIKDFQHDESGGDIHAYEYTLMLFDKNDYFGVSWKAV